MHHRFADHQPVLITHGPVKALRLAVCADTVDPAGGWKALPGLDQAYKQLVSR